MFIRKYLKRNLSSLDITFYDLLTIIVLLVPLFIGLIGLFDKDRPESTLIRVVYSLMWILIPLIILYYFYKDLITSFIER